MGAQFSFPDKWIREIHRLPHPSLTGSGSSYFSGVKWSVDYTGCPDWAVACGTVTTFFGLVFEKNTQKNCLKMWFFFWIYCEYISKNANIFWRRFFLKKLHFQKSANIFRKECFLKIQKKDSKVNFLRNVIFYIILNFLKHEHFLKYPKGIWIIFKYNFFLNIS